MTIYSSRNCKHCGNVSTITAIPVFTELFFELHNVIYVRRELNNTHFCWNINSNQHTVKEKVSRNLTIFISLVFRRIERHFKKITTIKLLNLNEDNKFSYINYVTKKKNYKTTRMGYWTYSTTATVLRSI